MRRESSFGLGVLAGMFITMTVFGMCWKATQKPMAANAIEQTQAFPPSAALVTEEHRGHWYIRATAQSTFTHSPECPCVQNKQK